MKQGKGTMPQQAMKDEEWECVACKPAKEDDLVIERGGAVGNGVVPARETKSRMLYHRLCQSWKGQ